MAGLEADMRLLQKAGQFVRNGCRPAKFAAQLMLVSAAPGPVGDLIGKVIDCAQDGINDQMPALANPADLRPVEKMFDLLLGDLDGLVQRFAALETTPDLARETLWSALAGDESSMQAVRQLGNLSMRLR